MKVLIFHIGPDRYGLRLRDIARVLPVLSLKQIPRAPDYVAGLMDFHGTPVPVIDLSRLAGLASAQARYDTRILLIDYALDDARDGAADPSFATPAGAGAPTRPTRALGLLAEHVLGIDTIADASLRDPGVAAAPYLGQVASMEHGMLQLVEPAELLAPDVRAILFQPMPVPA